MFKDDYKAAFSKVTASGETYWRVMQMTQRNKQKHRSVGGTVSKLLIAAIVVSLLAVTASAAEYVRGWFTAYFSDRSEISLSDSQLNFIAENEQKIHESQTQDEWTVQLRSAMNDGNTAYIIIGVVAPDGVNLEQTVVDDRITDWFGPGNGSLKGSMRGEPDVVSSSEGWIWSSISSSWKEDGDGLANTKNYVIQIYADPNLCKKDPFGSEVEWYIHIENIVREYENEAYRQELMNGKYKGQTDIMFTSEETELLHLEEVLAEGTWDFTINFAGSDTGIELLTQPVTTSVNVIKNTGPGIADYVQTIDDVTMTSFVLKPLSASIRYEYDGGVNFTDFKERFVFAVMKDGSRIELEDYGSGSAGNSILQAKSPIVLGEVDYILLADGTRLPMPE